MNTDARGFFDALTEQVLGAVFEVSHTLGAGFLEKVYQRALLHELRLRGIRAAAEVSFPIGYKGQGVGEYFAESGSESVEGKLSKHSSSALSHSSALIWAGGVEGAFRIRHSRRN